MGFNIAGLLINKKLNQDVLSKALKTKLVLTGKVDFEEATSNFKEENAIDVLESDSGTMVFTALGQMYDLTTFSKDVEVIQFMISDVSDTFYFEKYSNGDLIRKLITTEGNIAEDHGEGIITEDDDFSDKVWEIAEEYLQNNFVNHMAEFQWKRYEAV